jgi:CHAD domain-containing protein
LSILADSSPNLSENRLDLIISREMEGLQLRQSGQDHLRRMIEHAHSLRVAIRKCFDTIEGYDTAVLDTWLPDHDVAIF